MILAFQNPFSFKFKKWATYMCGFVNQSGRGFNFLFCVLPLVNCKCCFIRSPAVEADNIWKCLLFIKLANFVCYIEYVIYRICIFDSFLSPTSANKFTHCFQPQASSTGNICILDGTQLSNNTSQTTLRFEFPCFCHIKTRHVRTWGY